MSNTYNLMGTINETAKRAEAEHVGITKTHIRRLVTSGELPSVRSGAKYLINWNTFMSYLNNPQPINPSGSNEHPQMRNIYPIPERKERVM